MNGEKSYDETKAVCVFLKKTIENYERKIDAHKDQPGILGYYWLKMCDAQRRLGIPNISMSEQEIIPAVQNVKAPIETFNMNRRYFALWDPQCKMVIGVTAGLTVNDIFDNVEDTERLCFFEISPNAYKRYGEAGHLANAPQDDIMVSAQGLAEHFAQTNPMWWGVHAGHCCNVHGCKYGEDEKCPVAQGFVEQMYPCEWCEEGI